MNPQMTLILSNGLLSYMTVKMKENTPCFKCTNAIIMIMKNFMTLWNPKRSKLKL